MTGILAGLASFLTAVSLVVAAMAGRTARGVAKRTLSREDTQQALDAQNRLLDRYEKRIEVQDERLAAQDKRIELLERTAEDAIADRNRLVAAHRQCEKDLELIKLELQGRLQ